MRGMYWSDFWKLLREHKAPNATLSLYGPNRAWPNKIDIYDRQYPRRAGIDNRFLGYAEADHWRDSHILTASWINGEIPMLSKGWLDATGQALDHQRTTKGAIVVVNVLLENGCLSKSYELTQELAKWERLSKPIQ
jgi:hypothetical protein